MGVKQDLVDPSPLNFGHGDSRARCGSAHPENGAQALALVFGVAGWTEQRRVAVEQTFPRMAWAKVTLN